MIRFISGYHFERDIDRQNALSELKRIEDLHVLGSQDQVAFFCFPTAAGSLRGYVSLAAFMSGEVVAVADEAAWNKIVAKLDLVVDTPGTAEALVKDFLHLTRIHAAVWEGVTDGVNLIRGVDDIPFKPDNLEHQVEKLDLTLDYDLRPPSVQPENLGYLFHGFSWQPYDGALDEHILHVRRDAAVSYERRNLAYPYGDYQGGCVFPLDSGPPMKVLERLARRQEVEPRLTVIKYLVMIDHSEFVLYKHFVDDNRKTIHCLLEDLTLDADPSVKLSALAALDSLTSERHSEEVGCHQVKAAD